MPELPSQYPRTLHIADLSRHEYEAGSEPPTERIATRDITAANVISSIHHSHTPGADARHYPVLDLDIPAFLVPSSTPGNSHLYLDVEVEDARYWTLLEALAEAGILQHGYVNACRSRGYTSVRLPWVRKPQADLEPATERPSETRAGLADAPESPGIT